MQDYNYRPRRRRGNGNGRFVFGIIIALFGLFLLLELFQVLPDFRFAMRTGWPLILIVIGVLIGIRHRFRNPGAWVLIIIGVANLTPAFEFAGVPSTRMVWPLALIGLGLFMVLRGRQSGRFRHPGNMVAATNNSDELNMDVTFGGRKEIVTSKDFKGGNIQTTFGGLDINLMQAEIAQSPAVLHLRVAFGGVELVVPSSWEIKSEIDPTMGSFEDKRVLRPNATGVPTQLLILRGSCSFGSIEVKSY